LIANALCNIDENGQIKVECMFSEEDKSLIKVTVHDEGKYMSQEEIRKIMNSSSKLGMSKAECNKALGQKELSTKNMAKLEESNLLLCKLLTEKCGGRISILSENGSGNSVTFTFRVDSLNKDEKLEPNQEPDFELEDLDDEEMKVSDYSSGKDCVRSIPSMK
jgi:K+-sensing histidine kinase KdpD